MPITNKPKYPVVDPSPGTPKIISNFNFTDLRNIFIGGVSGYAFGWFPGFYLNLINFNTYT